VSIVLWLRCARWKDFSPFRWAPIATTLDLYVLKANVLIIRKSVNVGRLGPTLGSPLNVVPIGYANFDNWLENGRYLNAANFNGYSRSQVHMLANENLGPAAIQLGWRKSLRLRAAIFIGCENPRGPDTLP